MDREKLPVDRTEFPVDREELSVDREERLPGEKERSPARESCPIPRATVSVDCFSERLALGGFFGRPFLRPEGGRWLPET